MKDSFILYKGQFAPVSGFSDEQLGKLFRALFEWQIEGKTAVSGLGPEVAVAFSFFVNQFKVDNAKYDSICESRSIAGKKGGRPKKQMLSEKTKKANAFSKSKKSLNDNENENENEKELVLPYDSEEFRNTWVLLSGQPKWRNKSESALQMSLDALGKYPEEFALELMRRAIEHDWQGVVFPSTPKDFEKWRQTKPVKTKRIITNINEVWEDEGR